MFHRFLVAGFVPTATAEGIIPGGQMKTEARRVSHRVPGAEDRVGPSVRFERYGRLYERALTRRELVFGVKAPDDGKGGGFAGLVVWAGYEGLDRQAEVRIDMARMAGAEEWLVQFVRDVIVAAGWTVESEKVADPSRYLY